MTDTALAIAVPAGLAAGTLLGVIVFGGLRLTVDRLATSVRPALLALGSLVVRMAVLAAGLVALSRLGWVAVAATLPAMLAVRHVYVRRTTGQEGAPWV